MPIPIEHVVARVPVFAPEVSADQVRERMLGERFGSASDLIVLDDRDRDHRRT